MSSAYLVSANVCKILRGLGAGAMILALVLASAGLSQGQQEVPKQEEAKQEEKPVAGAEATDELLDEFFGPEAKKDAEKNETDKKDADNTKTNDKEDVAKEDKPEEANGARAINAIRIAPAAPRRALPAMRVQAGFGPIGIAMTPDAEEENEDLDPRMSRLTKALKLERALLRRACTLTDEQEKSLDAWDAAWIQAQLKTDEGKKLGRKLTVVPVGYPDVPFSDIRNVLIELVTPELKKVISEEQFAQYSAEVKARNEFEKQSQVDAVVAIVDHHLMLTTAQREEVEKSVVKMSMLPLEPLNYLRYGQYIPNMSFAPILKHLTKYQRKILQGLQQVQFGTAGEEDTEVIER